MLPPWMRYTPKTPFSRPARGHHGTHQGDAAEYPPTVRPRHPLPAGILPRAHPTPEHIAPLPPWKRYTPTTHRHSPPAGTAPGPQHTQAAATHRPADPASAIPHTNGPTKRRAGTPKHHTTTPPWLRHSSPAHPAPGDPRPYATPTPHRPRTETHQENDQETTRGCPTPPEDKPQATAHPTRPGHGAPPPPTGRPPHSTTPPYHTAPPSPTRGHGTPQPTNTGTKPRPTDPAPHPTGTTPGNPAHLAPAQHPPPATTRTAHRGNTTGQDSHQRAATHHSHAKRRASPGARPRTGRRTCPEHQHHTPTVP